MSHALTLYRLQQTDTRIDQAQARLQALQAQIKNDPALQAARAQAQNAQSALQTAEEALHQAEAASLAVKIKRETAEAALYGGKIHNPKELQDLQSESAALKRRLAELEDTQLEAMLALESARQQQQTAQTALNQAEQNNLSQNARLRGEAQTLQREMEPLQREQSAALSALPPALQNLYLTLRSQKRGIAISQMRENACGVCGSTINAALAQAARRADPLVHCPSCGRILFHA